MSLQGYNDVDRICYLGRMNELNRDGCAGGRLREKGGGRQTNLDEDGANGL